MKPLRSGKARNELAQNLRATIEQKGIEFENMVAVSPRAIERSAAILGGAIEAALLETFGSVIANKEVVAIFWRTFNHSTWQLTRTLKASNLLDKIK